MSYKNLTLMYVFISWLICTFLEDIIYERLWTQKRRTRNLSKFLEISAGNNPEHFRISKGAVWFK